MSIVLDLSEWQGSINFHKVKADDVSGVILRTGYGRNTDKYFYEYVSGCQEAGLPIVGVYHFSYALTEDDAKNEAVYCANILQNAGIHPLYVFYDFEYDTVDSARRQDVYLDKEECTAFTVKFNETIRSYGYEPGIYLNLDYLNRMYDRTQIAKYPLWIACWGTNPTVDCLVHQYRSDGRVNGINTNVDMNLYYGKFPDTVVSDKKVVENQNESKVTAQDVLNIMKSWFGLSRANQTHKRIVDIYNSQNPLPVGYRLTNYDDYCDATVTAAFHKLGALDLIGGGECGVERHIQLFKNKGIWNEDGTITPKPGYIICYNWDQSVQPNNGFADHIGIVADVKGDSITVYEGNMGDEGYVGSTVIPVGWGYIRGYAIPKYGTINESKPVEKPTTKSVEEIAREVIAGKWGNAPDRPKNLSAAGYDYNAVQAKVNEILLGVTQPKPTKTVDELAKEVIAGKWGNAPERYSRLIEAGYDYNAVQSAVNRLLS